MPSVVVTTGIWADVVSNVACDGIANVESIVPVGGDPHGFEPSLQDRARMESAALVVSNGLDLEEGLLDTLEAVADSGIATFELADGMDTIPYSFTTSADDHADHSAEDDHAEDDHSDHADADGDHADHADESAEEGHADHEDEHDHAEEAVDEHADHDHAGHDHGGDDPHIWFDPTRVSGALDRLAAQLVADAGLDASAVEACVDSYQAELAALDAEIEEMVAALPTERRKLITNHDAFGYYADRYGFEVLGSVIPSVSTLAQTNPAHLEALAHLIEEEGIPAVFAETQTAVADAEALAATVGGISVVTLYTGSLGPAGSGADTYAGLLRTNTELIVDALG